MLMAVMNIASVVVRRALAMVHHGPVVRLQIQNQIRKFHHEYNEVRLLAKLLLSLTPSTSTASTATPRRATSAGLRLFGLRFRCVIDQQRLQWQTVRQNVIPNVIAAYAQRIQLNRITILDRHFDGFQMCIHSDVHAGDGAMDLCAVLQLNCHRLMAELHQKAEIFIQINITLIWC